jgi:replicative DNA helicase
LALEALRAGKIVQFFSLEMQNESVMERMLANQSGVPIRVMVDKCMTESQRDAVENAKSFFQHSNLYMEDDGNMSVATIRAKARKLARKGLDMIVVDYAQLIRPEDPRASREQQVAMISKGIKMLAKELGIPIIMLAQLSRNADQQDTCPKLSDLRESGSLEQDADLVLMLWRKSIPSKDEYHHVVTVAKQRNGRLGPVDLDFKASVQQFKERKDSRLN